MKQTVLQILPTARISLNKDNPCVKHLSLDSQLNK